MSEDTDDDDGHEEAFKDSGHIFKEVFDDCKEILLNVFDDDENIY